MIQLYSVKYFTRFAHREKGLNPRITKYKTEYYIISILFLKYLPLPTLGISFFVMFSENPLYYPILFRFQMLLNFFNCSSLIFFPRHNHLFSHRTSCLRICQIFKVIIVNIYINIYMIKLTTSFRIAFFFLLLFCLPYPFFDWFSTNQTVH